MNSGLGLHSRFTNSAVRAIINIGEKACQTILMQYSNENTTQSVTNLRARKNIATHFHVRTDNGVLIAIATPYMDTVSA